jgi:hypothetical protein
VLGPRWPKQAGFLGEEIPRYFGWVSLACGGQLEDLRGQNWLTVNRTIRAGFSSKRYRKGTCLVQVQPVNGWIWRSWNGCQNLGAQTKPLVFSPPAAKLVQHLDGVSSSIPGTQPVLVEAIEAENCVNPSARTDDGQCKSGLGLGAKPAATKLILNHGSLRADSGRRTGIWTFNEMHAELRRLHSPDIDDLEEYKPADSDCFGFLLQVMIGPAGGEGEESFDVLVCTPEWLKRTSTKEFILGRHHLIVFRYDYKSLVSYIAPYAEECSGKTWQEVAQQLSRFGKWEFEDYRE